MLRILDYIFPLFFLLISGFLTASHTFAKTSPPTQKSPAKSSPQSILATSPQWQSFQKRLASPQARVVWLVIQELSKFNHPVALYLLHKHINAPDAMKRWWIVAALKGKKDPKTLRLLRKATKDRDERVRLNAVFNLIQVQRKTTLQWLSNAPRDTSKLVRLAICNELSKKYLPELQKGLQRCLQDNARLIKSKTAQSILKTSGFPIAIQQQALLVLRKRVPSMRVHRSFTPSSARYRVRSALRQVTRQTNYLKNYLHRAKENDRYDAIPCLKKHISLLDKEVKGIQHLRKEMNRNFTQRRLRLAQAQLARILLAQRRARFIYNKGYRCYYRGYRYRRNYYRSLLKAIVFPDFPIFLETDQRNYIRFAGIFSHDTFYGALRNDIHPFYKSYNNPIEEAKWDLLMGGQLQMSYNTNLGKRWIFHFHNEFTGNFTIRHTRGTGLGNKSHFSLQYGSKARRSESSFFIQNTFDYTQDLPFDTGFPDFFVGQRMANVFQLGMGKRWFIGSRRRAFRIQLRYQNTLDWPLLDHANPWGRRMVHHVKMRLEHELYRSHRIGLLYENHTTHLFDPSDQIPALQFSLMPVYQFGQPFPNIHFRAGLGLGIVRALPNDQNPVSRELQTKTSFLEQANYIGPVALIGVYGGTSFIPLQWLLEFRHQIGPSIRPEASYSLDSRIRAELRWSKVPPILMKHFPRHTSYRLGTDIRIISVPGAHKEDRLSLSDRLSIVDLGFYLEVAYAFTQNIRILVHNRVGWIKNGFQFYRIPGLDRKQVVAGIREATDEHSRNLFLIKAEYWF